MADDKTAAGTEPADAVSSSSPAEKPARSRSRAAKPAGEADAAKPARTRAAAKPAAEKAAAKPARTRAAAKQEDAAAAPAKAPRSRAKAAATEAPAVVAAEAPKPARASAKAPAKPAAAPARRRREVPVVPVTVRAHARYVRSSARKARLVCDHIRGKSVPEAKAVLAFAPRGVARDWTKLLDSAIANAENNHELVADDLHVTAVYADEGPTIKRFTPRAMGRATPIHKRTSHLTIELGIKE